MYVDGAVKNDGCRNIEQQKERWKNGRIDFDDMIREMKTLRPFRMV